EHDATVAIPDGLRGRLWPFPIHPLLIAAYPILLAYSDNLAEVVLSEIVRPLLGALAVAAVLTLGLGLVLRDLRRGALVASVVVAIWFAWNYLLLVTAAAGASMTIGAIVIVWLALMAIAISLRLPERRIGSVTSAVNVMAGLMLAIEAIPIVPHELRATTPPIPLAERPAPAAGSRDVWFLVFDRYGNNEALEDAAGIENDLPAWLAAQGFSVASEARANYGRTALSLSATLNMTYLDDIVARLGPASDDEVPLTDMLRDNRVGRFLQERGYRYVQVGSWFGPTKYSAIADENPVMPGRSDFVNNVLRNASIVPLIDTLTNSQEPPSHDLLHREAALFDWAELDRVSQEPGPKFVFGHVLLPHEPYVFNADGSYSHLSLVDSKYSAEAHRQQLAYTNGHIRDLVSRLLDVPAAEQPIVIVAADEGPYPDAYAFDPDRFDWATATDDDLVRKYGVLMAMYLPGEAAADVPEPYSDMSVINTFPIVFDRYFDQQIPLFDDRSYTSQSWSRPYDLTDITERLDSAMP
ncbi:MAG: hypothetical protein U0667_19170, partial [Chloroflexota bacterium]